MKKIIVLFMFFIFTSSIVLAESNTSLRMQEKEIIEEIKLLKNEIKKNPVSKKSRRNNMDVLFKSEKLGDLSYKLAKIQGRIIDLSDSTEGNLLKTTNIIPSTGDIIVFKPKSGTDIQQWWTPLGHGWQHAEIFYNGDTLLGATGPGNNSRKISWTYFKDNFPIDDMESVILIKMNLTSSDRSLLKNYQDNNQIGIPYPASWKIPFTKYSESTWYCSSLVWGGYYWGLGINLDTVASPAMVWPVDLLNSTSYWNHYAITW